MSFIRGINRGSSPSESSAIAACPFSAMQRWLDGNCHSPWLAGIPAATSSTHSPVTFRQQRYKWAVESRGWCGGLKVLSWENDTMMGGMPLHRKCQRLNLTLHAPSSIIVSFSRLFSPPLVLLWPPHQTHNTRCFCHMRSVHFLEFNFVHINRRLSMSVHTYWKNTVWFRRGETKQAPPRWALEAQEAWHEITLHQGLVDGSSFFFLNRLPCHFLSLSDDFGSRP